LPSAAKSVEQRGVEGVERAPDETLRLDPEDAEVGDDGRAALAVVKDVDSASPVVQA
jgi:hypothetical protein